jgi:4-hydroxybenzoyl-CoA thioesterase
VVRSNTIQLHVKFGDCDPAGIVFYPNYFRWMDSVLHGYYQSKSVG